MTFSWFDTASPYAYWLAAACCLVCFRELNGLITDFAAGLRAHGLQQGDRVSWAPRGGGDAVATAHEVL
jgi:hypothetical protein